MKPFKEIEYEQPTDEQKIKDIANLRQHMPEATDDEIKETFKRVHEGAQYFMNDLYIVAVRPYFSNVNPDGDELDVVEMAQISIRRHDKGAMIPWEHKQLIKSSILGRNCEAVELYPNEDRNYDTLNQHYLWAIPNESFFPFGIEMGQPMGSAETFNGIQFDKAEERKLHDQALQDALKKQMEQAKPAPADTQQAEKEERWFNQGKTSYINGNFLCPFESGTSWDMWKLGQRAGALQMLDLNQAKAEEEFNRKETE